jgi:stearoyl-CoA desaturase (delta-9 desaturase)
MNSRLVTRQAMVRHVHWAASMSPAAAGRPRADALDWGATVSFVGVHLVAVAGVVHVGFSWRGGLLAAAMYFARMFGVTAGFHRYFAHRAFKTSRAFQFLLALLATTSTQQGPLWWAGHHRVHHKHSDEPGDVHSMRLRGFVWAHVGWILSHAHDATPFHAIKDFAKYPELRWLNRLHLVPSIALAVALLVVGGPWALVWGYFVSTTLLWHGTFTLNSVAHWRGGRRYATSDASRNNLAVALLTMGEGWHNNHHHYPRSARQGFYFWEIDVTYYVLSGLAAIGLVWDLHVVPEGVRERHADRATRRPSARHESSGSRIALHARA